ncbi:MAG: type B 50S ribosomal protein L31 [Chlamydiales bacterium]
MKDDIHPAYQDVLFIDTSTGHKFVIGSTMQPKARETFEGKEYPVCHLTVSSASHPFFTGSNQFIDTEGRVDKFLKRYANKKQVPEQQNKEKIEEKKVPAKKGKKK